MSNLSGCKVSSLHCISPLEFNVTQKIDTTENSCFIDGKQNISINDHLFDDGYIAPTYYIMPCDEYSIPDLPSDNDMICDINYGLDEHGCEISQINCIILNYY